MGLHKIRGVRCTHIKASAAARVYQQTFSGLQIDVCLNLGVSTDCEKLTFSHHQRRPEGTRDHVIFMQKLLWYVPLQLIGLERAPSDDLKNCACMQSDIGQMRSERACIRSPRLLKIALTGARTGHRRVA